ncbi:hypothetical protein ACN38_g2230 [Penicillium nordicum]|uniref:Uncharacterized protein n=1 Tax=Penicillium nordicum TaxID=229535 RepID=A0A0M8PF18_9EURO|nr:hypothetical protein ACN38_g2230 [Penicillium nordicum]
MRAMIHKHRLLRICDIFFRPSKTRKMDDPGIIKRACLESRSETSWCRTIICCGGLRPQIYASGISPQDCSYLAVSLRP